MGKEYSLNQSMNASSYENQVNLEAHFDKVARLILNHAILKAGEIIFRFTEIEFYFYNEAYHKDPFIHKHALQKLTGHWYFHGSGLDITFGDGINFGGILIRGIKRTSPEGDIYIDGPLNVVTEIFKSFGNMSVKEHLFHILETSDIVKSPIVKSTRVGLKPKGNSNHHEYYYRYISFPFDPDHMYSEKTVVAGSLLNHARQIDEKELTTASINEKFGWKILK